LLQDSSYILPILFLLPKVEDRIVWGTDWPHPDSLTPPGRKPTEVTPMFQIWRIPLPSSTPSPKHPLFLSYHLGFVVPIFAERKICWYPPFLDPHPKKFFQQTSPFVDLIFKPSAKIVALGVFPVRFW
jgi:hypothetical protein